MQPPASAGSTQRTSSPRRAASRSAPGPRARRAPSRRGSRSRARRSPSRYPMRARLAPVEPIDQAPRRRSRGCLPARAPSGRAARRALPEASRSRTMTDRPASRANTDAQPPTVPRRRSRGRPDRRTRRPWRCRPRAPVQPTEGRPLDEDGFDAESCEPVEGRPSGHRPGGQAETRLADPPRDNCSSMARHWMAMPAQPRSRARRIVAGARSRR